MFFSNIKYKILISSALNICAGILTVFAFAPYDMWYMAIASLTIFFITYMHQSSKKTVFLQTYIYFCTFNMGTLWWISHILTTFGEMSKILAGIIIFIFSSYLSLLPCIASILSYHLANKKPFLKNLIIFPTLLVGANYLNGYLFTGFSWTDLGYTQVTSILKAYAPLLGVEGVCFVLFCIASNLSYFLIKKNQLCLIPIILLIVIAYWINSSINFVDKNNEQIKVALIQGNIKNETKWNKENIIPIYKTYYNLTQQNLDAQIIVWPESALPAFENDLENPEYGIAMVSDIDNLAKSNHLGLITGVQSYKINKNGSIDFYNGLIGIGLQDKAGKKNYVPGISNRYHKKHLVPLGEFIPFSDILRSLGPIFNMPMSSFTHGERKQQNIEVFGFKVASAICYEIIFNYELLDQVTKDTNFIVTISNDGWFNYTNGPFQHLAIAKMRALEFQKPILRATNNGITAVIDHKGKIVKEIPQNVIQTLKTTFEPTYGQTPFSKYGHLPMFVYILIILLYSTIKKYKH
ncbi:MAG: apolipoprotein N-acyltransferase [Succinivibrionaceae bacterium]